MNKYRLYFFIIFIFTFSTGYCEKKPTDSLKNKSNKINLVLSVGTKFYTLFVGNPYFPLDTIPIREHKYPGRVGWTYKPSYDFHSAFLCNYTFKKRFSIESGLQLIFSHEKYIMNTDTTERNIVNQYNIQHSLSLDTFKSIKHSNVYVEMPLYLGYSIKKFSGLIGIKLTSIYFTREHKTSLNNYEVKKNSYFSFFDGEWIPSLKIKYLLLDKKINLSSYFTIDIDSLRPSVPLFYFQIGFEIKLHSFI